ncbi:hypothetical protein JCM8097_009562 [Rhodosporidiobolus ruineniae]
MDPLSALLAQLSHPLFGPVEDQDAFVARTMLPQLPYKPPRDPNAHKKKSKRRLLGLGGSSGGEQRDGQVGRGGEGGGTGPLSAPPHLRAFGALDEPVQDFDGECTEPPPPSYNELFSSSSSSAPPPSPTSPASAPTYSRFVDEHLLPSPILAAYSAPSAGTRTTSDPSSLHPRPSTSSARSRPDSGYYSLLPGGSEQAEDEPARDTRLRRRLKKKVGQVFSAAAQVHRDLTTALSDAFDPLADPFPESYGAFAVERARDEAYGSRYVAAYL